MIEEKKIRASEAIEQLGKKIYGEKFSISDKDKKEVRDAYQTTYQIFLKTFSDKFSKGVFVIGNVGTGKSAMMKVLQMLVKDTERRFKWVNAYELKDLSETQTSSEIKALYGANLKCDLYIDDIGFSADVKRYGNTINIISEILMERYDLYISSGYKTHISTNIPTQLKDNPNKVPTIELIYGLRILDRIKEMCDLVVFKGNSLRK
ncbi:MAG: hypothetical protein QG594_2588 [Bacteroidota bacterium]|jgi:DNA replication protein DnaC|nr:hypothetical protein [Bacteroidota bacterium]